MSTSAPFTDTGSASITLMLVSSALVMVMTPAVGILYSGLSPAKNALTIILLSVLSYAVVAIQWVLFGFSLSFSETGSAFIGNFGLGGLSNVGMNSLALTAPQIPAVAFCLYQMQFATVTVAIIFGSVTERIRILPAIVFMFVWTTLIYDPTAYWTWGARGWLHNLTCLSTTALNQTPCGLGGLDFAGGGPVHMTSGFAGIAYSIILGKRRTTTLSRPHNISNVFLGTALLWFGWFGFNGASAIGATPRAAMAGLVTTIAASAGGLTWVLLDHMRNKKMSGIGFCSGVLTGLVGITPASGFVAPWAAIIIGAATAITCHYACLVKELFGIDDSLDAFGIHGVGGFVGSILTGIFAQKWVAALDGTTIIGGAIDGFPMQIGYQLAGSVTISAYSFFGTLAILVVINKIPGLHLRSTQAEEALGGDVCEMGEVAYELVLSETLPKMEEKKAAVIEVDTYLTGSSGNSYKKTVVV